MKTINYYEIEFQTYHGEIVGRIIAGEESTSLYSLHELTNIICLWKMGKLCGSFGIGSILASDAIVGYRQKTGA